MSEVKNKQEEAIQPKVENESKSIVIISAPGGMNIRTEPDTTSESVRVANHKEVLEVILNLPYGCVIKQK